MNTKQLRLALGLTQEQFAAKLGVTMNTVSRWERGLSKPSPLAEEKIKALDTIINSQPNHGQSQE